MKKIFTNENGYLLVSTLFFLVFSGVFAQSLFMISRNHLIQQQQLSNAYQAKATLNMSESVLLNEINQGGIPNNGVIKTSHGTVNITNVEKEDSYQYELVIQLQNGMTYTKITVIEKEVEEDDILEKETVHDGEDGRGETKKQINNVDETTIEIDLD